MADELSTIPQIVNVAHYGGDTLTIQVIVAAGVADGLDWKAEIKADRFAAVDATFVITPPAGPGLPAYLVLPAAISEKLVAVHDYVGVWDCQVSDGGSDPVRTLLQGTMILTRDVTR